MDSELFDHNNQVFDVPVMCVAAKGRAVITAFA